MRNRVADSSAFMGILQISRNSRWCGDFAGSDEGIRVVEDCLAERDEFELSVPICKQPDDNIMSGSAAPRMS